MVIQPAIVIVTYNRPQSFERLLNSISNAIYEGNDRITLVISIDGSDSQNVMLEIANNFEWQHGEKKIIAHKNNLGLRKHIISCGDLSDEFGSIIVLEDDLFVSPFFYDYAVQVSSFYENDKNVAGIALNTYRVNEYAGLPFIPMQNGYDVFSMQIPCSWGQVWTSKQWQAFKYFYDQNRPITSDDKLPESVKNWPESSWKKYFYKYMVENNLYFIYPYNAYTTNFGDSGTNYKKTVSILQVPLMNVGKQLSLPRLQDSIIKYDAYFELLPHSFWRMNIKNNIEFCVDLYGTKQSGLFHNQYWLSSKACKSPIDQYGIDLVPVENNILCNCNGSYFSFSIKDSFIKSESMPQSTYLRILKEYGGIIYKHAYKAGYNEGDQNLRRAKSYKLGYYLLHPTEFIRRIVKMVK